MDIIYTTNSKLIEALQASGDVVKVDDATVNISKLEEAKNNRLAANALLKEGYFDAVLNVAFKSMLQASSVLLATKNIKVTEQGGARTAEVILLTNFGFTKGFNGLREEELKSAISSDCLAATSAQASEAIKYAEVFLNRVEEIIIKNSALEMSAGNVKKMPAQVA